LRKATNTIQAFFQYGTTGTVFQSPVSGREPYRIWRDAGSLIEVPGSTTQVGPVNLPIAGGGYFRILPYWWTRWGIGRVNRVERRPAIFYLHPWEIDPEQPRLNAGRLGQFRHYRNLACTEQRLRQLLDDFTFDTMHALVSNTALAFVPGARWAPSLPYSW
jgi:hypothetical protein